MNPEIEIVEDEVKLQPKFVVLAKTNLVCPKCNTAGLIIKYRFNGQLGFFHHTSGILLSCENWGNCTSDWNKGTEAERFPWHTWISSYHIILDLARGSHGRRFIEELKDINPIIYDKIKTIDNEIMSSSKKNQVNNLTLNRKDYYSRIYVLLELTKQLKNRYLSVRKKRKDGRFSLTRYYQGYSLTMLKDSLERSKVLENESSKIYFDLSTWKDDRGYTPLFSFDKKKREEQKENFNKNFNIYFKGYDFPIDIDSEDINVSWKDARKIKKLLDDYRLPYSVKFSGSRGFHFLIEDKWFNSRMKASNKVILFGRMAKVIMGVCGLISHDEGGTFDDSIYDDRRIFKLAYSLNYKDGKEYVCLPLDDVGFERFRLEDMELEKVMRTVKISNRGLIERNHGLNEEQLKDNIIKFIGELKNGNTR